MIQLAKKTADTPVILKTWDELNENNLLDAIREFVWELDKVHQDNAYMRANYFLSIDGTPFYIEDLQKNGLFPHLWQDDAELLRACKRWIGGLTAPGSNP